MRRMIVAAIAALAIFAFTGCESQPPNGQEKEDKARQSNYDKLVKNQPAHSMSFSPTRETKNFWVDTWNEKGKLSYIYLLNNAGTAFGYFIFEGLPVSYCTSLVVPYQVVKPEITGDNNVAFPVPGPSVDGTFSSSSNCNVYYGKDATSGAYMEYTTGQGLSALVFDQPMSQFGAAEPLGDATPQTAK